MTKLFTPMPTGLRPVHGARPVLLAGGGRRGILAVVGALLCFSSCVVAQAGAGDADSDWRFLQRLRSDGMNEVAARESMRFADAHPQDPRAAEALFAAGQEFERLEQAPLALGAYDRILREHPENALATSALLSKAQLLSTSGDFALAVDAYRALLNGYRIDAKSEEAQLGLAEALMALGEAAEARRNLRHLLGRPGSSVWTRAAFDLGLLHLRAGEDSLALRQFDLVAEQKGELIAAFGLLRAADRLVERGDAVAARRRYERVLAEYDESFLRARAHLSLAALARAEEDEEVALRHYRAVADGMGSPEQTEAAWIGVAQSALALGDAKAAEVAAGRYLELTSSGSQAAQARLFRAQAMRQRGSASAVDSLQSLASSPAREVAHAAWIELALAAQSTGDGEAASSAWREAARTALSADGRAEATLAEAVIASAELERPALATELAEDAARRAESPEVKARALWVAASTAREAGDPTRAQALATEIITKHPLSEQARLADLLRRQLGAAMRYDISAAAAQLAQLAERTDLTPFARVLAIARVERDRWGELARAAHNFERSLELATSPIERAQAGSELALTKERLALQEAWAGSEDAARHALAAARRHYAEAASVVGGGQFTDEALLGLLRLELAFAAAPSGPWLFDASKAPLLGGVGVAEACDLTTPEFEQLRQRIDAALRDRQWDAEAEAWLRLRQCELSADAAQPCLATLSAALASVKTPSLQHSLTLARAQLALLVGPDTAALADLQHVIEAEAGESALSARYVLAEEYRTASRFAAAEQLYVEFAGAMPRTQKGERALLLSGDCAFFQGDAERAQQRYEELLRRHAESVYADDALYRLATAQMRLGRAEAARAGLLRLAAWEGGSEYAGKALLRLAELQRRRGELADASASLERLLELDRELAQREDVLLQLAQTRWDANDARGARRWLDRREAAQPLDAVGLALRVQVEAGSGDFASATAALEKLEVEFPQRCELAWQARLGLAEILAGAEKAGEAVRQFNAVREAAPDGELRAQAEYGLGLLAAKAGDLSAAHKHFQRLRESAVDGAFGAPALFKLGQLQQHAQQDGQAQASYAELVQRHPQHALAVDALRAEARVWRDMGRYDEAILRYQRLLDEYPFIEDGAAVVAQIAYCQHEAGQFEASIDTYRRVMPELADEERGYAQFWVADGYAQLGHHAQAAAEFLRIPYLYPKLGELPVTAQLRAGEAYERAGDLDSARRLYERVRAAHDAASTWGIEARKRLDRLSDVGEGS